MKSIPLYANYSGSDKIVVDMSNQVYHMNYGKIINIVIVDLFQLIIGTIFVFNMK